MKKMHIIFLIMSILFLCFCENIQKKQLNVLKNEIDSLQAKSIESNNIIDSLNTLLDSLDESIKLTNDITESFKLSDRKNYIVLASGRLSSTKKKVFGDPILLVIDGKLFNPRSINDQKQVKDYFKNRDRVFSLDYGGLSSGYLKPISDFHIAKGVDFDIVYRENFINDTTSSLFPYHYQYIISSLLTSTNKKYRIIDGLSDKYEYVKTYVMSELLSSKVNISNVNELRVLGYHIFKTRENDTLYCFGSFQFRETIKIIHNFSFCSVVNNDKVEPFFKKYTHANIKSSFNPLSYHFLDVFDYNFDGNFEILIEEVGYEHRDVIMYELKDNNLNEIYRISTSNS